MQTNRLRILPQKTLKGKIPETSGVYVFWKQSTPLYVGKALNLKSRVSSYFSSSLIGKTKKMVREAETLSFVRVASEIEALLLEAKLVRKMMPKYNFELRDDKNPLYIKITKEPLPRVILVRKNDRKQEHIELFGPFVSSRAVRNALRQIRRVIPFSDHTPSKRPCILSHIGLCSPCPGLMEEVQNIREKELLKKKYLQNVSRLRRFLRGNTAYVKKDIEREMKAHSKRQDFEKAQQTKKKLEYLNYLTNPPADVSAYLSNPNLLRDTRQKELKELKGILKVFFPHITLKKLSRIECYDVSHTSGESPTASMVTFVEGEPEKSLYRHFKVRQPKGTDDVSSLREIALRRKKSPTLKVPDLILIDGGKGQVGAFEEVFGELGVPIVGIAKRTESLVIKTPKGFAVFKLPAGPALFLLQRLRDEAHRFSRRYHHHLLGKSLIL